MLSNANRKLGKDKWNFNLPISSCLHKTSYCDKYCYAKKGAFLFESVQRALERNYQESLRDNFVKKMIWVQASAHDCFYNNFCLNTNGSEQWGGF